MSVSWLAYLAGMAGDAWLASFVLMGEGDRRGRPSVSRADTLQRAVKRIDEALRELPATRRLIESARRREQRNRLLRELPQLMDVVTLGLLSGLSFDASLSLYCERYDSSTSRLFEEAMTSWRLGVCTREEALGAMAERMDVGALRRFSAVVAQALHFGSPLAQTLERQSRAIREEQRSEVEEEIERVPVRMLIPRGTLIVPAMLLAILGPLLGGSVLFS